MIHDKDRSGWIGASDTAKVMGSWGTKTFDSFWREKLGVSSENIETIAMKTGSFYEGKILDALKIHKRDRQIRIPALRLRVNLDGETDIIHEIKTHKRDGFEISKSYWMQAQVEMFATRKPLEIIAYRLDESDYENWLSPIDLSRITRHPIPYDRGWVEQQYLPRLKKLAECLQKGAWPNESDILSSQNTERRRRVAVPQGQ